MLLSKWICIFATETTFINNQLIDLHMETKKKKYVKPTYQVYELREPIQLLAGSGLDNPGDYGDGGNPFAG